MRPSAMPVRSVYLPSDPSEAPGDGCGVLAVGPPADDGAADGAGFAAAASPCAVPARKAMTSSRSCSDLRPGKGMRLPGTAFCGSTRYLSSVCGVQVMPACFIAGE